MRLLNYYLEGRRFEWLITIAMLWLAVAMFIAPQILRASAFQWATLVMTPWFTASCLFAIGWARLVGLLLNGHQVRGRRVGPMIRAVTAAACAVMWVQFDLALIQMSFSQGFMSPGVPFWSMFVLGELDVAYRVVANGRNR
ncbi:hypothetical protein J4G43_030140 [Bradyrhizobium barranii subsp. barranii]|uniref:Transmembrane protein n=2 Tax=Bradyrhizobium TaxID=374 RepID=A0A939M9T1_9BRAD|nr:hypothetical protein [Bradyrhizobium barranii]UEM09000.1 hypothetical protein J4G43_030140 [Bradyrhizobium barranii subsp. barranii]